MGERFADRQDSTHSRPRGMLNLCFLPLRKENGYVLTTLSVRNCRDRIACPVPIYSPKLFFCQELATLAISRISPFLLFLSSGGIK